jgi:hypothetical protein
VFLWSLGQSQLAFNAVWPWNDDMKRRNTLLGATGSYMWLGTVLFSLRTNRNLAYRSILLLTEVLLPLAVYYVMFAFVWSYISLRFPAVFVLALCVVTIVLAATIRYVIYVLLRRLLALELRWHCRADRFRDSIVQKVLARLAGFAMVLCALSIAVVLIAQIGARFNLPLYAYGFPPMSGLLETTAFRGLWLWISFAGFAVALFWLHRTRDPEPR